MKRRHDLLYGSSEYMLDTVCNVFGSLVLMAILIVLQMQGGVNRITKHQQKEITQNLQTMDVQYKITILKQRIKQLEEMNSKLSRTVSSLKQNRNELLLSLKKKEFEKAILSAKENEKLVDKDLEQAQIICSKLEEKQKKLVIEIENKDKLIVKLQTKLKHAISSVNPTKMRLPHRRGTIRGTPPKYVLIEENKFYILGEEIIWYRTRPFLSADCIVVPITSIKCLVKPNYTLGTVINKQSVNSFLRRLSPEDTGIVFWVKVSNRSFENFQKFKNTAVKCGFEYAVGYYSGEGIVVVPGRPLAE